jgi:serine/threonine protein kinase
MTTNTQKICPKCQTAIPNDAPGGLCPKCVLANATASTTTTSDLPRSGQGDVPSIDQLKPVFPQFEILELIGRGGMGYVYKARQLHLGREVALKLLPEKLSTDPHFAERFMREARVLARLNHPNIVMVHDFGHTGGYYYLVMEFVDGLNLRQAMRMGKFSPAEALAIVPKICDALQYAHEEGVLHRDIKPENILLDARGRVKIADFGIAKIVGEEKGPITLTGTGASLGTPHYMAPEQFENPSQVDHRADIYSLGVVFYEMLTGELPLGRFSAPSARADLDERIDAIVLRALARERDLRQKNARELQTEVETVASTQTFRAEAPQPGTSPHRTLWLSYGSKLAWSAAAVLLILVAIILLQQRDHQKLLARFHANSQPFDESQVSSFPSGTNTPYYPATPTKTVPDIAEIPIPPAKDSIDPTLLEKQKQTIAEARARYEEARARHSRGEITDRQLALFNRDVLVAEARSDKLAIAKAHYDFLEWEYRQINNGPYPGLDAIYKLEEEMNKAQHAIERARAGTNSVQIALADLKYAERAWGIAQRRGKERIERNGIVTNFLSEEIWKKRKDDLLYAQLHYHQVKQKAESTPR